MAFIVPYLGYIVGAAAAGASVYATSASSRQSEKDRKAQENIMRDQQKLDAKEELKKAGLSRIAMKNKLRRQQGLASTRITLGGQPSLLG